MSSSPPGHDTKIVLQLTPCRVQCRVVSRVHNAVSHSQVTVSQRCRSLYRDPEGRPQPRYKICITTHTARRSALSWCLLAVSRGRVTGLLAVSWPLAARPCPAVPQYNLVYRDPAHNENEHYPIPVSRA